MSVVYLLCDQPPRRICLARIFGTRIYLSCEDSKTECDRGDDGADGFDILRLPAPRPKLPRNVVEEQDLQVAQKRKQNVR
ncbi:hypothetical protein Q9L58_007408 [Maublancomyces gigas]|uniref:Uncharacterized protein n=1 Tax=Discina gigas TaxID=1032678 RepID=A0ABR3GD38_9PEZI